VIATGFKSDAPQRRERGISSSAQAISRQRVTTTFGIPDAPPPVVNHVEEPPRAAMPAPAPVVPTFEHDDLDVPTFIRKRTEVN
jgi:hypothetical protein